MSGMWWACAEPERPTDAYVVWHYDIGCKGCMVKAEALARRHPNDERVQFVLRAVQPHPLLAEIVS